MVDPDRCASREKGIREMIGWVLILAIETDGGAEVHQTIIPGFQTYELCIGTGQKLRRVATEQLAALKSPKVRVQGNIRCESAQKSKA